MTMLVFYATFYLVTNLHVNDKHIHDDIFALAFYSIHFVTGLVMFVACTDRVVCLFNKAFTLHFDIVSKHNFMTCIKARLHQDKYMSQAAAQNLRRCIKRASSVSSEQLLPACQPEKS